MDTLQRVAHSEAARWLFWLFASVPYFLYLAAFWTLRVLWLMLVFMCKAFMYLTCSFLYIWSR